ncbi:hypothetical protein [Halomonas sp. GT]|uniref:hypothetical protein n=1 Tax=Halomonas sp. GT TaxID=1971364 RepID=UPI0009F27BFF|nr:hypothetical protein [Halomonas sp. GT]
MTEKQFQIFCKVIYRVTVMTLMLQIVACGMMFWMFWRGMPEYQDVLMGLAGSIIWSLMLLSSKKTLFKRKEVKMGTLGDSGIMHSLGANIFWWCGYHFFELFFVLYAIWLYIKVVWL